MKNILVVSPTVRDFTELQKDAFQDYTIIFDEFTKQQSTHGDAVIIDFLRTGKRSNKKIDYYPERTLAYLIEQAEKNKIAGVFSTRDYPGSTFGYLVANHLKLNSPAIEPVLLCQNKYLSRIAQQKYVPEATPPFWLYENGIEKKLPYPVFAKPVKSNFSVGCTPIHDQQALKYYVNKSVLPDSFFSQFNWFMESFTSFQLPKSTILLEECLSGVQTTLEGFVCNNQVVCIGITDSIMLPNGISFKRFEYPSSLAIDVQHRMETIAQTFMQAIGFNNGFFNIEFMYNPTTNEVHIIEVNPRFASQFADLYEKVDGVNGYELLLQIVTGAQPIVKKNKGKYNIAASCVLRVFEDKKVKTVPTKKDWDNFYTEFPDARGYIYAKPGIQLSDLYQDGKSFRYGLIHLGARDRQELLEKLAVAEKLLPVEFCN